MGTIILKCHYFGSTVRVLFSYEQISYWCMNRSFLTPSLSLKWQRCYFPSNNAHFPSNNAVFMNEGRSKTGIMQMKWDLPISPTDFRLSCAPTRLLPWGPYTETQRFTIRVVKANHAVSLKVCQELLESNLSFGDLG